MRGMSETSVDFPELQVHVGEDVFIAVVASCAAFCCLQSLAVVEAQVAELDFSDDVDGRTGCGHARVGDLGGLGEDRFDTEGGGGAALEDVDNPSQGDDRPGQLHHVGVEGHEAADRDPVVDDLNAANPEHDHDSHTEQSGERGPQHSHEANEFEAAGDVFLVGALEQVDLRLLLYIGADDAGTGEILLGASGDIGKHGLNALEALMDLASEILHHDADDRERRESEDGEPGADAEHEHQGTDGEYHGVGGVHDSGTD
jgi:hypothetical protein